MVRKKNSAFHCIASHEVVLSINGECNYERGAPLEQKYVPNEEQDHIGTKYAALDWEKNIAAIRNKGFSGSW